MIDKTTRPNVETLEAAQFSESIDQPIGDDVMAWELIDSEAGRYMPRRIRGSFRGRALG